MVEKNAISRVCKEQEGFHFQLFMVLKNDGGQRPIINLKKLNSFVQTKHFKMEGIHMLKDLLKPGKWMIKVNLKDAYLMIPIATNHRRLLQFKWLGKTYQFNCLPFGLSSAPWVFTKTTKPIVAILRTMGLRMIIYIDDILILSETESLSREQTGGLVFLLENLGFIINYPKSILEPSMKIEFLGFIVDSTTMEIKLSGEKIKKIRMETRKLKDLVNPQAIIPVKTTGQTQSCHTGNPTCSSILQQLTVLPKRSPGERRPRLFNAGQTNTGMHRGTGLVGETPDQLDRAVSDLTKTITSDGDRCINHRLGSYMRGSPDRGILVRDRESFAHKLHRTSSSDTGCQCFGRDKENIVIILRIDKTTAIAHINKLSVSPELNCLTKDLWLWCLDKNITLQATHLAGVLNVTPDIESRVMKDRTD